MGAKNWNYSEIQYLKQKWGELSIKAIAKHLNRSINAIKIKAYKVGLRRMIHSGEYITYNQLFNIINGNKQHSYCDTKLLNAGFPIKTQQIVNRKIKVVYMDDFWRWFKKNKHLIDLSKTEEFVFGYEPDWVSEKRAADKRAAEYKKSPWTRSEDEYLKYLLSKFKYGYREISIKLKRTEGAIKRRMIDLNIKDRPIKADNNPWTNQEITIVKKLYSKGYKSCIIAEYINRSALAINGLLERYNYLKNVKVT